DFLSRIQERMPAGLTEKELQRVGRRLLCDDRRRWRRRRGLLGLLEHFDASLVELAVDGVRFEQAQVERLEHLGQLGVSNRSGLFSSLEQLLKIRVCQQRVQ